MKVTQKLYDLGQSLWLDHITRDLLSSGTLKHYIEELSLTGLTSNPNAFGYAIRNSSVYDGAIRNKLKEEKIGEELYFELALEDLGHAADLLRPIYDQTDGADGWVSLEVSPLLIHDADSILAAAMELHARGQRPNFYITIPGTKEGLPAVEQAIFAGVPVNVTFLSSHEQYLAAAGAFLRGIERRIAAGLKPNIGSVASMLVEPWGAVVIGKVPESPTNSLGLAVARRTYKAYCDLLSSQRWQHALNAGARPQRLLWSNSEISADKTSDRLNIENLAAPFTIITMSESFLKTFAKSGKIGKLMPSDGGDCEAVLARSVQAGIDINALAAGFQKEGIASAVKSWIELMTGIAYKSSALTQSQY